MEKKKLFLPKSSGKGDFNISLVAPLSPWRPISSTPQRHCHIEKLQEMVAITDASGYHPLLGFTCSSILPSAKVYGASTLLSAWSPALMELVVWGVCVCVWSGVCVCVCVCSVCKREERDTANKSSDTGKYLARQAILG